jgi:4'-phosphopantetheinyl transferase
VTQTQWQPGPARPRLDADTVDVWLVDLPAQRAQDGRSELLSADERARAGRFVREQDSARWAHARSALRALLGAYTDADPRALRFIEGPHGKPELVAPAPAGLRFNLSHSGDLALIAIALDREVGVDVELPRRAVDHVAIARRVLTADEADRIQAVEDPQQRERAFLQAWVRWEAVLKCHGTGIGGAATAPPGPEPWVVELVVAPPAAAALAVAGDPCAVRAWRWSAAAA